MLWHSCSGVASCGSWLHSSLRAWMPPPVDRLQLLSVHSVLFVSSRTQSNLLVLKAPLPQVTFRLCAPCEDHLAEPTPAVAMRAFCLTHPRVGEGKAFVSLKTAAGPVPNWAGDRGRTTGHVQCNPADGSPGLVTTHSLRQITAVPENSTQQQCIKRYNTRVYMVCFIRWTLTGVGTKWAFYF